jgi:predicted transcriptional regulator
VNDTVFLDGSNSKGSRSYGHSLLLDHIDFDYSVSRLCINSKGELIGLIDNETTDLSGIRSIDVETGSTKLLGTAPISGIMASAFTIDNSKDRLYIGGSVYGDNSHKIITIDSINGTYLRNVTIDQYYRYLYVNKNGDLVGLRSNSTANLKEIKSINPITGITKLLGTASISSMYGFAVDIENDILYISGEMRDQSWNEYSVISIDATTGKFIKYITVDTSFHLFINSAGELTGVTSNDTSGFYEYWSINPNTGQTIKIGIAPISSYRAGAWTIDNNENRFYVLGHIIRDIRTKLITLDSYPDKPLKIISYEWDFDGDSIYDYKETIDNAPDGVFNGKTIYQYNQTGVYTVTIRAVDENGSIDTDTCQITVVLSIGGEDNDGQNIEDFILILILGLIIIVVCVVFFLTEIGLWLLMRILVAPLYSKLKKDAIFDNETRETIYNHIVENPGIHYVKIKKNLNLNYGTLTHHLMILLRENQIKKKNVGIYKKFYPQEYNGIEFDELSPNQEIILKVIKRNKSVSQSEISEKTGISLSTVSRQLKKLENKGFISSLKRDGIKKYRVLAK